MLDAWFLLLLFRNFENAPQKVNWSFTFTLFRKIQLSCKAKIRVIKISSEDSEYLIKYPYIMTYAGHCPK